MNLLFPLLIFISVLFAALTGRMEAVSKAAMESASEAVTLALSLMGTICLWSGMMEIANASGVTARITAFLSPLLKILFGKRVSGKALQAIAANLSANLLGLGNAAAPLGLAAMKELQATNNTSADTASDEMVLFTVMNTSSLQLIPATVAGLRLASGSSAPTEILPAVWIVSAVTLTVSVLAAKMLSRCFH